LIKQVVSVFYPLIQLKNAESLTYVPFVGIITSSPHLVSVTSFYKPVHSCYFTTVVKEKGKLLPAL